MEGHPSEEAVRFSNYSVLRINQKNPGGGLADAREGKKILCKDSTVTRRGTLGVDLPGGV